MRDAGTDQHFSSQEWEDSRNEFLRLLVTSFCHCRQPVCFSPISPWQICGCHQAVKPVEVSWLEICFSQSEGGVAVATAAIEKTGQWCSNVTIALQACITLCVNKILNREKWYTNYINKSLTILRSCFHIKMLCKYQGIWVTSTYLWRNW